MWVTWVLKITVAGAVTSFDLVEIYRRLEEPAAFVFRIQETLVRSYRIAGRYTQTENRLQNDRLKN